MLSYLSYLGVRGIMCALQAVPYETSLRLARSLSRTVYRLDGEHRRRAILHLRMGYGETLGPIREEEIARGTFEQLGKHMAEVLQLPRRRDISPRWVNPQVAVDAHRQGRGVVAVSAHLGSFAMMAHFPQAYGIPVVVILKRQKNMHLLKWALGYLRERFGVLGVVKTEARDVVADYLRKGYLVGFFSDQHPSHGGIPTRFFGRPIKAAAGPAVYAKRCGSPIVVVTITSRSDSTNVAAFDGPVSPEGSNEEVSQRWLDILETRIREHPEQWMWMHRRWRDQE